jgi:uncharacterized membrane protein
MMDNQNRNTWFTIGNTKCGLLFGGIGVLVAFLLIFLGFWNTVLVAAMFAAGFWIGAVEGKTSFIKNGINRMFPPKGE